MTLTENGKRYIAQNFGINNCNVQSGMSWNSIATNGDVVPESGATASIVSRLVTTSVYDRIELTYPRTGTYRYSDLQSGNDGQTVTLSDASWIAQNDGYPSGENQYCAGSGTPTKTPTPTGTKTPTPPPTGTTTPIPGPEGESWAGTYEFSGPPEGAPNITLELYDLEMRQKSSGDYHFEMNNVKIINNSGHDVYIAFEVRLFSGSLSSCPSFGWVFQGANRVETINSDTGKHNLRVNLLDPYESRTFNLDFFQPSSIRGVHTVCLYVHGDWTKDALVMEMDPITG